jgi:hypothetical protein
MNDENETAKNNVGLGMACFKYGRQVLACILKLLKIHVPHDGVWCSMLIARF